MCFVHICANSLNINFVVVELDVEDVNPYLSFFFKNYCIYSFIYLLFLYFISSDHSGISHGKFIIISIIMVITVLTIV